MITQKITKSLNLVFAFPVILLIVFYALAIQDKHPNIKIQNNQQSIELKTMNNSISK